MIETLQSTQDIVEFMQNQQIEGVKDVMDKTKLLKDAWCCSDWLSEPKATGN